MKLDAYDTYLVCIPVFLLCVQGGRRKMAANSQDFTDSLRLKKADGNECFSA